MKRIKQQKIASKQSGFTLIEIMVVVIIIGLLSAMIVPNIFRNQAKAFKTKAETDIRGITSALSMYRLDKYKYPSTSEGLAVVAAKPDAYLPSVPKDPWGNPYQYQYPGTRNTDSFDLWSFGPDGTAGGEGDNADVGNWEETQ